MSRDSDHSRMNTPGSEHIHEAIEHALIRYQCLLPLANTPIIEYTLEFLVHVGVQDVILYCGTHADQVEHYIESVNRRRQLSLC